MPNLRAIVLLISGAASVAVAQDRRNVTEPVIPPVCISLEASGGPSGPTAARDPHTHFLTPHEVRGFLPAAFFSGADGWNPEIRP